MKRLQLWISIHDSFGDLTFGQKQKRQLIKELPKIVSCAQDWLEFELFITGFERSN